MTELSLDEFCEKHGLLKPSRRVRLIKSAPRVGQYYWVDFPHDAYAPEFVGEHPGIVVRAARSLDDTCIIVPVTSTPQGQKPHIHQLGRNPNRRYPDTTVWAVCNHLYTIHTARLRMTFDRPGSYAPSKVDPEDMEAIFACIRGALPRVFGATTTVVSQTTTTTIATIEPGEALLSTFGKPEDPGSSSDG